MNMALVHQVACQVASSKFVGTSTVWTCQDKAVDFYKINVIYLVLVNHTVNQFRTRCPECSFASLFDQRVFEVLDAWSEDESESRVHQRVRGLLIRSKQIKDPVVLWP